MNNDETQFPCIDKGGIYVTLNTCRECRRQKNCDIYVTMLNEEYEEEEE